jgi:O-antigen/teichoic acid export membrane protein
MILARLLSPTEFGIAAVATMVVQFGYRITQFGLNAAIVRVRHLRREHETSVFSFNLAVGLAIYLALVLAAPRIGRFFGSEDSGRLLPLAALVFVVAPFGTVPGALLSREFRYRELSGLAFLDTLIGSLATILLAYAGFSFWSLPAGLLAGNAVATLRRYLLSNWRIGVGFSWPAFRELVAYGGGVQTKRLLQYAADNLHTFIVGKVLGVTALGFYDKGFSTMSRLTHPLTFGTGVTFRIFAEIAEEPARFRRAYHKTMTVAGLMAIPMLAGAALVAHELVIVAYGERWTPGVPVFQFLCLSGACRLMSQYVGNANEAVGGVWLQAGGQAVSVLALTAGVVFGARFYGIDGAAAAMAASGVLDLVVASTLLVWSTPVRWSELLKPYLVPMAWAAGLVPVVLAARALAGFTGLDAALALLAIETAAGFLFSVAFVLWCPERSYREVAGEFLEDVGPRLPPGVRRWLSQRLAAA